MADTGGIAGAQLKAMVERVERLEEEKKSLADDIRDVYAEAKANGFDVKTIRTIIRLRKLDRSEREEAEALLDLYLHALGMAPDSGDEVEAARDFSKTMGRQVEPTEAERAQGVFAAWETPDGGRSSLATGR